MNNILVCLILSLFSINSFAVDCESEQTSKLNPFAKGESKCVLSQKNSSQSFNESKVVLQNLDKLIEKFNVWDDERSLDIQGLDDLVLEGTAEQKRQSILHLIVLSGAYGINNLNDISRWAAGKGVVHPQENILRKFVQLNSPQSYSGKELANRYLEVNLKQLPENMRSAFARGIIDYKHSGHLSMMDLNLIKKYSGIYSDDYLNQIISSQVLSKNGHASKSNLAFLKENSKPEVSANLNFNTSYNSCKFEEIQDALAVNLKTKFSYFIRTTSVGCTISVISQNKNSNLIAEVRIENENQQNILYLKKNYLNPEQFLLFLKTGVYKGLPSGIFFKQ